MLPVCKLGHKIKDILVFEDGRQYPDVGSNLAPTEIIPPLSITSYSKLSFKTYQ